MPTAGSRLIAEGEESDLERFAKALMMKNTIIDVSSIQKKYDTPTGIFDDFSKIVEDGETDARLDTAIDCFKELIDLTRQGLDKQDMSLDKLRLGFKCFGYRFNVFTIARVHRQAGSNAR